MPRTVSCQRGHRWQQGDEATSPAALVCPVCGSPAQQSDPRAGRASADDSTVLQESWNASPTSGAQPRPEIPDFDILSELGRGGMGIVYKARQVSTNHVVAVKVIRKDRLQHEEAVRRFRREAQAAARLHHPNIVRVLDSDHSGDTHYLAMEYVDGMTLEKLVEKQGPLPVDRACDYIRQAALGLQHAHEMGLVHRDIKPSNLMVLWSRPDTADGQAPGEKGARFEQVKILDMGVARVLGGPLGESFSTLTQGGAVIGTADYIAPEQLEDPHGADIRADLYSLGCTFYFLLTGRVPFPGGSLVSKLDKQRWQTPTSLFQLRAGVSPAVAALVQKLMAKRPEDRFRTPAELAAALDGLARNGYTGAEQSAPLKPVQKLLGHQGAALALAFAPNGKLLASAGKDRQLLLWDAASGVLVRKFPPHPQEIRALAFSPDSERLLSASGITVRCFAAAEGQETRRLAGHTKAVRCLAFSADGRRLASGAEDRSIRVWELATGREAQRFTRHQGEVTGVAFLPGGELLLSCSRDQTLRLWDLRSGQETLHIAAGGGAILGLALSSDGQLAVSAHFDTVIRLWDMATGQELRRLVGHKQMVTSVALTPDGSRCLSASQDQTVRLWDTASGRELAKTPRQAGAIQAVALAHDTGLLASAGADGSVGIWQQP